MKIFKIESNNISYDEDVSMVIVAEDETRALNIARENWSFRGENKFIELNIIEIDITYEQIIDISHYGD